MLVSILIVLASICNVQALDPKDIIDYLHSKNPNGWKESEDSISIVKSSRCRTPEGYTVDCRVRVTKVGDGLPVQTIISVDEAPKSGNTGSMENSQPPASLQNGRGDNDARRIHHRGRHHGGHHGENGGRRGHHGRNGVQGGHARGNGERRRHGGTHQSFQRTSSGSSTDSSRRNGISIRVSSRATTAATTGSRVNGGEHIQDRKQGRTKVIGREDTRGQYAGHKWSKGRHIGGNGANTDRNQQKTIENPGISGRNSGGGTARIQGQAGEAEEHKTNILGKHHRKHPSSNDGHVDEDGIREEGYVGGHSEEDPGRTGVYGGGNPGRKDGYGGQSPVGKGGYGGKNSGGKADLGRHKASGIIPSADKLIVENVGYGGGSAERRQIIRGGKETQSGIQEGGRAKEKQRHGGVHAEETPERNSAENADETKVESERYPGQQREAGRSHLGMVEQYGALTSGGFADSSGELEVSSSVLQSRIKESKPAVKTIAASSEFKQASSRCQGAHKKGFYSGFYFSWCDLHVSGGNLQVWNAAKEKCEAQGMRLISLDSQSKSHTIKQFMHRGGIKSIWTGGYRTADSEFRWSNGYLVDEGCFRDWHYTGEAGLPQPDNMAGDEFCLAVMSLPAGSGLALHDQSCPVPRHYICEPALTSEDYSEQLVLMEDGRVLDADHVDVEELGDAGDEKVAVKGLVDEDDGKIIVPGRSEDDEDATVVVGRLEDDDDRKVLIDKDDKVVVDDLTEYEGNVGVGDDEKVVFGEDEVLVGDFAEDENEKVVGDDLTEYEGEVVVSEDEKVLVDDFAEDEGEVVAGKDEEVVVGEDETLSVDDFAEDKVDVVVDKDEKVVVGEDEKILVGDLAEDTEKVVEDLMGAVYQDEDSGFIARQKTGIDPSLSTNQLSETRLGHSDMLPNYGRLFADYISTFTNIPMPNQNPPSLARTPAKKNRPNHDSILKNNRPESLTERKIQIETIPTRKIRPNIQSMPKKLKRPNLGNFQTKTNQPSIAGILNNEDRSRFENNIQANSNQPSIASILSDMKRPKFKNGQDNSTKKRLRFEKFLTKTNEQPSIESILTENNRPRFQRILATNEFSRPSIKEIEMTKYHSGPTFEELADELTTADQNTNSTKKDETTTTTGSPSRKTVGKTQYDGESLFQNDKMFGQLSPKVDATKADVAQSTDEPVTVHQTKDTNDSSENLEEVGFVDEVDDVDIGRLFSDESAAFPYGLRQKQEERNDQDLAENTTRTSLGEAKDAYMLFPDAVDYRGERLF